MLDQLGVNSTFFVMMAVFVGFFAVNYFLSLSPLSETLVERDKRMAGRDREIKAIQAELQETTTQLNEQMKKAQAEAGKKFLELRSAAAEKQRALLLDARNKAAAQMSQLREDLNTQLVREGQKLGAETSSIVNQILERFSQSTSSGLSSKRAPRTEA